MRYQHSSRTDRPTNDFRRYSELIQIPTFEERFKYLSIAFAAIGDSTFGDERYLNQRFYSSTEWRNVRRNVIARDLGHDLAMQGLEYEIQGMIYIHHLNPITSEDLIHRPEYCLNPEFLVCCSENTHKAIHYGSFETLLPPMFGRSQNDTCPWLN